jgi:NAD+ synthase
MTSIIEFSRDILQLDVAAEIDSITEHIRRCVRGLLRKKGAVVAVSGGVDSALCAALCVRALGKEHVISLSLPERDSSLDSLRLGKTIASSLGIKHITEDISSILEASGCYVRQLEAICAVFPEYSEGWKSKVSLPSVLEGNRLNVSKLTVQSPSGEMTSARMPAGAYLQLIAATNFKQRTRTMLTYYHADRLHHAVCGTPNRLEYDQGFFVKGGDGLADFKPIAHLYKSQVYMLARELGIPSEICDRPPTTDTFSLPQTQEEFYFALPYEQMDLCLYAHNHHVSAADAAPVVGLTAEQVVRVYECMETKRRATLHLHLPPLMADSVHEILDMVQRAKADV